MPPVVSFHAIEGDNSDSTRRELDNPCHISLAFNTLSFTGNVYLFVNGIRFFLNYFVTTCNTNRTDVAIYLILNV